eukprot:629959-Amphidinium_carterae.1
MQNQCPKGKGGKGKGKDGKGKAQYHNFEAGGEQQAQGHDEWWWWWSQQQWWPTAEQTGEATGVGGTLATPGPATQTQAPQTLNALKLNTLLVENPCLALSSFSSSVLKLKVDSGAGASVISVGSSLEPVQNDDKTGRVYFTANGEKVYDKGVQHVRGTVKGASAPVDVKLRVADIREGLLSVPEIVDKGFRFVFDSEGSFADTRKAKSACTSNVK